MSEEIAMAAADLAHIDRLRERLNAALLRAEEAERELGAARELIARVHDVRGCKEARGQTTRSHGISAAARPDR